MRVYDVSIKQKSQRVNAGFFTYLLFNVFVDLLQSDPAGFGLLA